MLYFSKGVEITQLSSEWKVKDSGIRSEMQPSEVSEPAPDVEQDLYSPNNSSKQLDESYTKFNNINH